MDEIKSEMMYGYTNKESLDFEQTPYTISNFLNGYELNLPTDHETEKILMCFLEEVKPKIQQVLTKELNSLGGIKFPLGLKVQMHKDEEVRDSPFFYQKQIPITNENEIGFKNAFVDIYRKPN